MPMINKLKLFVNPRDTRLRLHFEKPFALTITSVKLFSYLSLGYGTVNLPQGSQIFLTYLEENHSSNV